jgi:hypothetical protein
MTSSRINKVKIINAKNISILLILIFISAFCTPIVCGKTLYKWIDKKGVIHLTDYPPSENEASHVEQIEVKEEKVPEEIIPEETPESLETDLQKAFDSELQPEFDQLQDIDIDELMKLFDSDMPFPITDEMIQVLEVAGNAIFILSFALSIFINLYLALCIYLIARKTGVSYAWMAFVPLLNILPLFGAAGYRWHVVFVVILAVVISLLPSLFLPQLALIITFVMAIALFIFFINLWMKICDNLGTSKWLGLLIIIPFINIFLPSYLAFKKETPWDGVRRLRPAVITFIAFLFIVGAYAFSAPYLIMPQVKEMLSTLSGISVHEEGTGIVIMPQTGSDRSQPQMKKAEE